MIAAAIFSLAGIIAWQNVRVMGENVDNAEFGLFAFICWIVAILCAIGVVHQ